MILPGVAGKTPDENDSNNSADVSSDVYKASKDLLGVAVQTWQKAWNPG